MIKKTSPKGLRLACENHSMTYNRAGLRGIKVQRATSFKSGYDFMQVHKE